MLALLAGIGTAPAHDLEFADVASEAGLNAVFPNGGDVVKKWILETTGSGAAFLDYDNDGLQDAFLVSGDGGTNRLYRNVDGQRFEDVTEDVGLSSEGWGQGSCAGDIDNDGFIDLFVTYWGQNRLYRNREGRRFEAAEVPDTDSYSTGCAFLDADLDGDLDLYISNYLRFGFDSTPSPGQHPYCFYRNMPVSCGPRGLPFARNELLRNEGDGTFTDVSDESGIAAPNRHYSLGVVTGDFNRDGNTDLYVACDRCPSILYMNQGDGVFRDEAMLRGAALDEHGRALSGMGAAADDMDRDGSFDIFRTNFSDERSTLYRNRGDGDFDDATVPLGVGVNTRYVGWGCVFADLDLDGWRDVILVNGHVFPEVEQLAETDLTFRQPAVVYRNLGEGRFQDISHEAGEAVAVGRAARGLAAADIDNDGRIEFLINSQNERPALLRMTGDSAHSWMTLDLVGTVSNRSAIGATVKVHSAHGTQHGEVRGGGSYLSQSDLRLHFGLANDRTADVTVRWPSGTEQRLDGLSAGKIHRIVEPCEPPDCQ